MRTEKENLEQQMKHWKEMAGRHERDKLNMSSKLVDAGKEGSLGKTTGGFNYSMPLEPGILEQVSELRERIHALEGENNELRANVAVGLKSEIQKLKNEADKIRKDFIDAVKEKQSL
jgi:hypothetical protein